MSETTFGTWTVPESPVDIEYSMPVIDEIRAAVAEGFQRLARGGIEVGGILYGTVVGRQLRILAVSEIACEHARGPTFHLSEKDLEQLRAQLERERDEPRLSGMAPVGWYLSHTRSEITLQPGDLDTYNTFFPEPWQVTMVVRPGRASAMEAGFFVRESDGTVKVDHSYQDFQFPERLAGAFDRPPRERSSHVERSTERSAERRSAGRDLPSIAEELSPQEAAGFRKPMRPEPDYSTYSSIDIPTATTPAPETPATEAEPAAAYSGSTLDPGVFPIRRKFPWTVIAVLAVGVVLAIAGLRFFGPRLNAEPLGLTVTERNGQVQIHWNQASRSITTAKSGMIEIDDGNTGKQTIPLNPPQLASGSIIYTRKTGDVQILLRVTGPGGSMEEGSRFLGNTPENTGGTAAEVTKAQRDDLQDEVERLREQNRRQAEQIQRLERTETILRSRLGITDTAH